MADRVHPSAHLDHSNPPLPPATDKPPLADDKPPISDDKPLLSQPQATYVIQIPKDQIYRIPPPENARKIEKLANRKPKRSCCCRCFCYTIAIGFILLILLAISGAIFYLIFRPESLKYSIDNISVQGINLTSSSPLFPRLTVDFRSENPNDKVSVYYIGKGSSVDVYYADDVNLCNGELLTFKQPANNLTVIRTALTGSDVVLARDVHARLVRQERRRNVPLKLKVKAPFKIKFGAVKTWEITVTVKCDVAVDRLTQKSKVISVNCDHRVKLW